MLVTVFGRNANVVSSMRRIQRFMLNYDREDASLIVTSNFKNSSHKSLFCWKMVSERL